MITALTRFAGTLLLGLTGVAAGQRPPGLLGPNLVRNAGFEVVQHGQIEAWQGPAEVYRSAAGVTAEGRRALAYDNRDPGRYVLFKQPVPLQPGLRYEVKAKVRTRHLVGDETGATVALEWSDAGGRYLGGCYPEGRKGDAEWGDVSAICDRVPPEATSGSVVCYVRRGMTGRAWWDAVSVRHWRGSPMDTLLLSPSYRGLVLGTGDAAAKVQVRLWAADIQGGLEGARVRAFVTGSRGEQSGLLEVAAAAEQVLRVPIPREPAGYRVTVELTGPGGAAQAREAYAVRRKATPPSSYIDHHRRLIVDGQPFLPLGMYFTTMDEEQLRLYAQGPFNTVMSYQTPDERTLDLLHKLGLKAIVSLKDLYFGTRWCPNTIRSESDEEPAVRRIVRRLRAHPAVLAWYVNDELPLTMRSRLEAHQRWVEEEDPDHPTWAVLFQVDDFRHYVNTFDVAGADPYPIPDKPAALAGLWTRMVRQAVQGRRAQWMVPQAFRWPDKSRPPSVAELRSMTWQCLAEGATGLIYYSWSEMRNDRAFPFAQRWPHLVQLAREVHRLAPVILSSDPVPPVTVTGPPALHWTARAHRGEVYVILVNDGEASITGSVHWPRPPRFMVRDGNPVSVGATMKVRLAPLGVSVWRAAW